MVERSAVNRFVVGSNPTWGDLLTVSSKIKSTYYKNVDRRKYKIKVPVAEIVGGKRPSLTLRGTNNCTF